jgi:hypothetical protein
MIRTYSELILLPTIKERFDYLSLGGRVGSETFGFERYLNQVLYRSTEWKKLRDEIIIRDNGCDLADPDYEIHGRIIIHHMNPITKEDIVNRSEMVLNPEYLICTSFDTHNAIHYGDYSLIPHLTERAPNDMCPWRN